MPNRVLNRIGQAVFTVFAVVTITFGMIRLLPGGPMQYMKARLIQQQSGRVDMEQINEMVEAYVNVNPDQPLAVQYVNYIISLAQGDLGQSLWYSEPVADIIFRALPWTVFVMGLSVVFTFLIGIVLGALMAYSEGGKFDVGASVLSILLNSIPFYIAAILLLYVLAYQSQIFPTGGYKPPGVEPGLTPQFLIGIFYHAALPATALILTAFGGQALLMRGNSIQVLGEDYIRVARLRGVPGRRIAIRYVGRNAVLPMYTNMMIALGFMFGGSVLLEEIFSYQGLGYYMFRAIQSSDYPLMMGTFLVITIAVVISVMIADLTYGMLDPRAGGEENESY